MRLNRRNYAEMRQLGYDFARQFPHFPPCCPYSGWEGDAWWSGVRDYRDEMRRTGQALGVTDLERRVAALETLVSLLDNETGNVVQTGTLADGG